MKQLIDVTLAGLTFPTNIRYSETALYFPAPNQSAIRITNEVVCLSDADWRYYIKTGSEACAHSEFSLLTAAFSDALMNYERIILHSVAIRWHDKAYLIAARSGTGKSTQARFLQELRPGEFSIICGDRPILQFCNNKQIDNESIDKTSLYCKEVVMNWTPTAPHEKNVLSQVQKQILVHPSPWNGKEDWHGADVTPLAGIILLERGNENNLVSLSPREAAIRTFAQVIHLCKAPDKIRKAAEFTTRLLNSVPIWQLTSFQVPDSTKLLLEKVFSIDAYPNNIGENYEPND